MIPVIIGLLSTMSYATNAELSREYSFEIDEAGEYLLMIEWEKTPYQYYLKSPNNQFFDSENSLLSYEDDA